MILRNKPLFFQSSIVTETGLSHYHNFIATFLKSDFIRLDPKTIDKNSFLNDLKETNFDLSTNDPKEKYRFIADTFIMFVERHAPLKERFARGNQASFMKKELRKTMNTKRRLRNNFL